MFSKLISTIRTNFAEICECFWFAMFILVWFSLWGVLISAASTLNMTV